MSVGTKHQFKTEALLDWASDSTTAITQELTSSPTISWSVDNSADLTTATTSSAGLITAGTTAGSVTITAFYPYSSLTATTTLTVTDKPLDSITVTAPSSSIAAGTTQQYTATGNYSDPTTPTRDFTTSVIWSSSNTRVATIDATGLVTAGSTTTSTTTIKATDPITGKAGSATLAVTP